MALLMGGLWNSNTIKALPRCRELSTLPIVFQIINFPRQDWQSFKDSQSYGSYLSENLYALKAFVVETEISLSTAFLEDFEFNLNYMDPYVSEASRCGLIITPILKEVYKPYHTKYSLWIQKSIVCNEDLTGTPDYLISRRSELGVTVLKTPLLVAVEAKKSDFDEGWGQCLAEMVAAQKINQDTQLPVYGIVTDGKLWEFGNLSETDFIRNKMSFTTSDLPRLAGAIDFLFRNLG